MLSVYVPRPNGLTCAEREPGAPLPSDAAWIDLREITPDEEQLVESTLGIDVPTPEEMLEIEASNRFYEENGALYMTATLVTKLDTDQPERTQVTFILTDSKLVTNRCRSVASLPTPPAIRRCPAPEPQCWPACSRRS
jgi:magnesium transporter